MENEQFENELAENYYTYPSKNKFLRLYQYFRQIGIAKPQGHDKNIVIYLSILFLLCVLSILGINKYNTHELVFIY